MVNKKRRQRDDEHASLMLYHNDGGHDGKVRHCLPCLNAAAFLRWLDRANKKVIEGEKKDATAT